MDDLISRQAAIDAIASRDKTDGTVKIFTGREVNGILVDLPSAQSEIIRCKDCKWWDRDSESVYGYCMAIKHGYHSRNWEIGIYRKYKGDFYCADAEIEEESDTE